MHDDQNELASYQPSNEPTKEQKEIAFKLWLESYWNAGPFTDISGEEIFAFPSGHGFLDLPGLSSAKTEKVAALYGYGGQSNFFGVRQTACQPYEMMMLDFILLDLADELGYDLIELQNEEHWQLYLANKEQIEKEGWIPYDGKGMPEGLEEKQVCICCFGDQLWLSRASCFLKGKQWSWHAFDNEYKESAVYAISFYKVKEESEEQKPVGNQENDNV